MQGRSPVKAIKPALRVGIIPLPDFTMLSFAGFVDTLRLAADDGDRSRQVHCSWAILSEDRRPVRASNGVTIEANERLIDPSSFDYLVIVAGTLHAGPRETPQLLKYLQQSARAGTTLVGLCTGVFTLARAGLMEGRKACVSWFHHQDYASEFPMLPLVSDRLFLDDGDRITCAGGVSAVHLASWLVDRHLGQGSASKGLRILLEEAVRSGDAPQPGPLLAALGPGGDARVRKAVLAMERRLDQRFRLSDLAKIVGTAPRHLSRLFVSELGLTPKSAADALRMARAKHLLQETEWSMADIAAECGFADSSHLVRRIRSVEGVTPGQLRNSIKRKKGQM